MNRLRRFEVRRPGLLLVMLGALSLSFSGQRESVTPLLGSGLAVVFAGTNDLAALLALNEVVSGRTRSIRGWAWVVLILSGGTGLGLNTWHAIQVGVLPGPVSIVTGAEPVLLAWVLSHVVALVMTHRREASATASPAGVNTPPATVSTGEAVGASGGVSEEGAATSQRAGTDVSPPAQPALTGVALPSSVAPTAGAGTDRAPEREAHPGVSESPADSPAIQLIDQAEKAERQALEQSGGKRGLSYRAAQRQLGVRYDTARAALIAARHRMTDPTEVSEPTAA